MFREIIGVYSDGNTKTKNTISGEYVMLLNDK
jgi:hypothetical protein